MDHFRYKEKHCPLGLHETYPWKPTGASDVATRQLRRHSLPLRLLLYTYAHTDRTYMFVCLCPGRILLIAPPVPHPHVSLFDRMIYPKSIKTMTNTGPIHPFIDIIIHVTVNLKFFFFFWFYFLVLEIFFTLSYRCYNGLVDHDQ